MFFSYSKENRVYTQSYEATENQRIGFNELIKIITSDPPDILEKIRYLSKQRFEQGQDTKKEIGKLKSQLPYFLCSGHCEKHHNNKTLEYNGCVQIDIDFKEQNGNFKALKIKEQLQQLNFISLACISPSGYGVKALVQTTNRKKENHKEVVRQVTKTISNNTNIDIKYFDSLSLSQPCYIPYDKNAYINPEFETFNFEAPEKKAVQKFERKTIGINESNAFIFATQFAEKEHTYTKGQKHLFINNFAICCNLLGVDIDDCTNYLEDQFLQGDNSNNAITFPYKQYKDSFGVWAYKLKESRAKSNRTIIVGQEGDRASKLLKGIDILDKRILAPTGVGKSFVGIHFTGKRVLVCSTLQAVENAMFDGKQYTPVKFTGQHKPSKTELLDSQLIITQYASLQKLTFQLGNNAKEYVCFLDEYHNFSLSTSPNFQLKDLHNVLDSSKKYKAVTMLSGTELYNFNPYINSLPVTQIKIPKKEKPFFLIKAKDTIFKVVEFMKASIDKGNFPIVLFNNKSKDGRLGTLQTLVKEMGITSIKYFNSDNKETPEFKEITSSGKIPKEVKGIVTTTVLKESNSLLNEYNFDYIIYGNFHSSEIEQLANRGRNAKTVSIHWVKGLKESKEVIDFNPYRYAQFLIKESQHTIRELNNNYDSLSDYDINMEYKARQYIQGKPIKKNSQNGFYEIDYLRLNNMVIEREKYVENKDLTYLKKQLRKYNIIYKVTGENKTQKAPALNAVAKENRQAAKARIEQDFYNTLKGLNSMPDPVQYADKKRYEKNLPKGERIALKHFLEFAETTSTPIQKVILEVKEIGLSNAKFQQRLKQWTIKQLQNSKRYMDSNRLFVIVLKAIEKEFKAGNKYSSNELKAKLIKCLSLDCSFDINRYTPKDPDNARNTRVLNTLRLFFEVKKVWVTIAGKQQVQYQILHLNFDYLLNNTPKNKVYSNPLKKLEITSNGYPAFWDS